MVIFAGTKSKLILGELEADWLLEIDISAKSSLVQNVRITTPITSIGVQRLASSG